MNLKEAFRYRNYLSTLFGETSSYLNHANNTTATKEIHLRSKANPDDEDEEVVAGESRFVDLDNNKMIDLLVAVVDEISAISAAISTAKHNCDFDIDSQIDINKFRRSIVSTMETLNQMRPSERKIIGKGYKILSDGNQASYCYDIKVVTSIDFDRTKAKGVLKAMSAKADELSTRADEVLVSVVVDHEPKFSISDSFADIAEAFATKSK